LIYAERDDEEKKKGESMREGYREDEGYIWNTSMGYFKSLRVGERRR
jgi:hypothetical protein